MCVCVWFIFLYVGVPVCVCVCVCVYNHEFAFRHGNPTLQLKETNNIHTVHDSLAFSDLELSLREAFTIEGLL